MKRLLLATASVLALSSPAKADPFSLAVAALGTAQAAATGSLLSLGAFSGLGVDFAIRAGLGAALNAMTTKPTGTVSSGYRVNTIGAALPHQIIYGETVIGGVCFYQSLTTASTAGDLLHRVVAFAGHEVDSFQAIYVNGEEVTLDVDGNVTAPAKWVGLIRIKQWLGTSTQTADPDLVAEVTEWTVDHRAQGIAALYARFKGASNFPNGVPVVTAKIRGRKIEDSRTSTTAWSDSPAMCLRDYVLASFGLDETAANVNDTLFGAAADICEETVSGSDRYTCNGAFTVDAAPEDIIRAISSSMGGTFWNYAGQWAALAAAYVEPTLTLTDDDLRTEINVATRHSRRDTFNGVQGVYRGAETEWQDDGYPKIHPGLFRVEDKNIEAITGLSLQFTNTSAMAARIASTFLRRNRHQETVSAGWGLRALGLKIGDTVKLTNTHQNWSEAVFEVVDWRVGVGAGGDIVINMILRQTSTEVFDGIVRTLADAAGTDIADAAGNLIESVVA